MSRSPGCDQFSPLGPSFWTCHSGDLGVLPCRIRVIKIPTCPHRPLESHFVEMHSGASGKIRPASLSSAPDQTIAVLPSPGWSPPSETSVSSPDRSHPLPSAATPAGVALVSSVPDIADRSPAPYWPPSQLPGHSSYRGALTGLPNRLLKALAEGRLARQQRYFLGLDPAVRTAHSIE